MIDRASSDSCLGYRITRGFLFFDKNPNRPRAEDFYSVPVLYPEIETVETVKEEVKSPSRVHVYKPSEPLPENIEKIADFANHVFDLSSPEKRNNVANQLRAMFKV